MGHQTNNESEHKTNIFAHAHRTTVLQDIIVSPKRGNRVNQYKGAIHQRWSFGGLWVATYLTKFRIYRPLSVTVAAVGSPRIKGDPTRLRLNNDGTFNLTSVLWILASAFANSLG